MGLLARLRNIPQLTLITVEPVMAFYAFAMGISSPASSALWYRKVCLNEYPEYVCDNLHNETFEDQESWVQKTTSQWRFYETICYNIPALVFSIIYGSWSDRFSRRIPIIIPLVGYIVDNALYLVNGIFMAGPVWLLLPGLIISGICGGILTLYSSVFSYVSEVSTSEKRTVRISIVYTTTYLSSALASFLSGVILDNTGFIFVYSLAVGFFLLALAYVCIWLKDKPRMPTSVSDDTKPSADAHRKGEEATANDKSDKPSRWELAKRRFGIYHIKDAFMIVIHKRPQHQQAHLIVLLSTLFYAMAVSASGVMYLYLVHLGFTQTLYGYYRGYTSVVHGLGLMILIPLFKNKLHTSDTMLMMISLIMSILSNTALAYVTEVWMVFLIPLLAPFGSALIACMRSMMSRIVEMNEQGKVMALIACIESIAGIVSSAFYSYLIYPASYDEFPGFSFILEAILLMVALVVVFILHLDIKGLPNYYETLEEDIIVVETHSTDQASLNGDLTTDFTIETVTNIGTGIQMGAES